MNAISSTTSTALSINGLSLRYGNEDVAVLDKASLQLQEGEIACLLGASGCGKTSLLRSIAGFETPSEGKISLANKTLFDQQFNMPIEQREIGMVFQDYALFPHLSVAKNICFGLKNYSKAEQQNIVDETLALLDLSEHKAKYPHQLSGGQQQRVAIGRAIACKPKLLLLDEPLSNLDVHLRERLAHDLRDLLKSQGITALMVTHDQQEAFAFADKIGVMHQGRIEQWARAEKIYHQPETAYVASFIGEGAVFNADQANALGLLVPKAKDFVLIRPEHVSVMSDGELKSDVQGSGLYSAEIMHIQNQGYRYLLRAKVEVLDEVCDIFMYVQPSVNMKAGDKISFAIKQ